MLFISAAANRLSSVRTISISFWHWRCSCATDRMLAPSISCLSISVSESLMAPRLRLIFSFSSATLALSVTCACTCMDSLVSLSESIAPSESAAIRLDSRSHAARLTSASLRVRVYSIERLECWSLTWLSSRWTSISEASARSRRVWARSRRAECLFRSSASSSRKQHNSLSCCSRSALEAASWKLMLSFDILNNLFSTSRLDSEICCLSLSRARSSRFSNSIVAVSSWFSRCSARCLQLSASLFLRVRRASNCCTFACRDSVSRANTLSGADAGTLS
mmetsp:Transcript_19600/g.43711  ORF Transcript_19600/g.43711 Transcript_19600/m.43711 type:complete len:278 (-) Transcript_19600:27-860(-)